MREATRMALVLAGRHLREVARSRGARVAAILYVAAVGVLAFAPGGHASQPAVTLGIGAALVAAALLLAASSAAALPGDRASGREEWLAALAPPPWLRRLGAILASGALLLVLLPAAGLIAAGIASLAGAAGPLRASEALGVPGDGRLRAAPAGGPSEPFTIRLPEPARAGDLLELDARTLLASRAAGMDVTRRDLARIPVAWTAGTADGTVEVSRTSPARLALPEGARHVRLAIRAPHVLVRVVGARRLSDERPYAESLLWGSLLVALCALSLVPVAVAASRGTSAPTAAGVALALALLGALRASLDDLGPVVAPRRDASSAAPSPSEPEAVERAARAFLGAASLLAPDLSALGALGELNAGRALPPSVLAGAAPALGYGAVALLFALVPLRRRRA